MNKTINILSLLVSILISQNIFSETYVAPPSGSTSSHVPYISDAAMEQCVKLYNEANWLEDEIDAAVVDKYSQASVNSYNQKINELSQMTNNFNKNCAGKQSESAHKAAQNLNNQVKTSK